MVTKSKYLQMMTTTFAVTWPDAWLLSVTSGPPLPHSTSITALFSRRRLLQVSEEVRISGGWARGETL